MAEQESLFDVEPVPPRAPEERPSYGRRLTARRRADLASGLHPVTKAPLLGGEPKRTCGHCAQLFSHGHSHVFHKCKVNATRGPATDIRVSWPACAKFTERNDRQ